MKVLLSSLFLSSSSIKMNDIIKPSTTSCCNTIAESRTSTPGMSTSTLMLYNFSTLAKNTVQKNRDHNIHVDIHPSTSVSESASASASASATRISLSSLVLSSILIIGTILVAPTSAASASSFSSSADGTTSTRTANSLRATSSSIARFSTSTFIASSKSSVSAFVPPSLAMFNSNSNSNSNNSNDNKSSGSGSGSGSNSSSNSSSNNDNRSNGNSSSSNNNRNSSNSSGNGGNTYGFSDGTTFSMPSSSSINNNNSSNNNVQYNNAKAQVAYKSLLMNIPNFDGVNVPVAMWFKPDHEDVIRNNNNNNNNNSSNENNKEQEKRTANDNDNIILDTVQLNYNKQQNGKKKKLIMDYPSIETSIPALTAANTSSSSSLSSNIASSNSNINNNNSIINHTVEYSYRISVKKIGKLLARLDFIPQFLTKDFQLKPTSTTTQIINGYTTPLPTDNTKPVVILAHGFLGSRFDLAHFGEELANEGFVVFSPEYPESLAASYEYDNDNNTNNNNKGNEENNSLKLDRTVITQRLLSVIESDLDLHPRSYGIVGHSLGTDIVMTTGDDTWTRVCIAGPPIRRDGLAVNGNTFAITSVNDGAVSLSRIGSMIPDTFVRLDEASIVGKSNDLKFPSQSILIIDRDDAPNHISFLAANVNDSMISFLSPLLPVAQTLGIPVLDFDKYKDSRDSKATAEVVIPLVVSFLKQNMYVD